jgi:hypothetical protein
MTRGGRAHGTREEDAIDSAGSCGTGVAFSRRIHLLSAREKQHSSANRRSTCGLAVLAVHTPLAKVLTVVAQQAVAIFSKPRASTLNDVFTPRGIGRCRSHPHRMSMSKA